MLLAVITGLYTAISLSVGIGVWTALRRLPRRNFCRDLALSLMVGAGWLPLLVYCLGMDAYYKWRRRW